jgi:arylsulfatase A-like enzyme
VSDKAELTPVEREYASMVLRLDQTVGLILDELEALGLSDNTMVIFASDNGHETNYLQPGRCSHEVDLKGNPIDELNSKFHSDTCGDVFDGNGGLAGLKRTNWEGGARIPFVVRWPGEARAGRVNEQLIANYDTLTSVADLLGVNVESQTDGISYLPALRGDENAPQHDHSVYSSYYGPSLVSAEGWKLRTFIRRDKIVDFSMFGTTLEDLGDAIVYQLYNLREDPAEKVDLSAAHPERVKGLLGKLLKECDGNLVNGMPEAHFAFYNREERT